MQQHFSQASTYAQQASQQAQRTQYPSFPQHINPYTSPYYRQQQSSAPQGTLSPHALHSSTNALPPSSFYTPPVAAPTPASAPQGPTPEERKQQFQNSIRPFLQSSAFTGAQAVNTLVERIADFGSQELDAATRLEILTKIRDGAGNHYFRAWCENSLAIDVTREWLKAAAKSDEDAMIETLMPLLHVSHAVSLMREIRLILFLPYQIIDRLPLTINSLKASKLGKIVVRLVKDAPSPGELILPISCLLASNGWDIPIPHAARHYELETNHPVLCYFDRRFLSENISVVLQYMYLTAFLCFSVALQICSDQGYGFQPRAKMASDGFECRRGIQASR